MFVKNLFCRYIKSKNVSNFLINIKKNLIFKFSPSPLRIQKGQITRRIIVNYGIDYPGLIFFFIFLVILHKFLTDYYLTRKSEHLDELTFFHKLHVHLKYRLLPRLRDSQITIFSDELYGLTYFQNVIRYIDKKLLGVENPNSRLEKDISDQTIKYSDRAFYAVQQNDLTPLQATTLDEFHSKKEVHEMIVKYYEELPPAQLIEKGSLLKNIFHINPNGYANMFFNKIILFVPRRAAAFTKNYFSNKKLYLQEQIDFYKKHLIVWRDNAKFGFVMGRRRTTRKKKLNEAIFTYFNNDTKARRAKHTRQLRYLAPQKRQKDYVYEYKNSLTNEGFFASSHLGNTSYFKLQNLALQNSNFTKLLIEVARWRKRYSVQRSYVTERYTAYWGMKLDIIFFRERYGMPRYRGGWKYSFIIEPATQKNFEKNLMEYLYDQLYKAITGKKTDRITVKHLKLHEFIDYCLIPDYEVRPVPPRDPRDPVSFLEEDPTKDFYGYLPVSPDEIPKSQFMKELKEEFELFKTYIELQKHKFHRIFMERVFGQKTFALRARRQLLLNCPSRNQEEQIIFLQNLKNSIDYKRFCDNPKTVFRDLILNNKDLFSVITQLKKNDKELTRVQNFLDYFKPETSSNFFKRIFLEKFLNATRPYFETLVEYRRKQISDLQKTLYDLLDRIENRTLRIGSQTFLWQEETIRRPFKDTVLQSVDMYFHILENINTITQRLKDYNIYEGMYEDFIRELIDINERFDRYATGTTVVRAFFREQSCRNLQKRRLDLVAAAKDTVQSMVTKYKLDFEETSALLIKWETALKSQLKFLQDPLSPVIKSPCIDDVSGLIKQTQGIRQKCETSLQFFAQLQINDLPDKVVRGLALPPDLEDYLKLSDDQIEVIRVNAVHKAEAVKMRLKKEKRKKKQEEDRLEEETLNKGGTDKKKVIETSVANVTEENLIETSVSKVKKKKTAKTTPMNSERAATELVEKLVKENPELNWKNVEALKRVGTIKRGTKNLRILKKKKKGDTPEVIQETTVKRVSNEKEIEVTNYLKEVFKLPETVQQEPSDLALKTEAQKQEMNKLVQVIQNLDTVTTENPDNSHVADIIKRLREHNNEQKTKTQTDSVQTEVTKQDPNEIRITQQDIDEIRKNKAKTELTEAITETVKVAQKFSKIPTKIAETKEVTQTFSNIAETNSKMTKTFSNITETKNVTRGYYSNDIQRIMVSKTPKIDQPPKMTLDPKKLTSSVSLLDSTTRQRVRATTTNELDQVTNLTETTKIAPKLIKVNTSYFHNEVKRIKAVSAREILAIKANNDRFFFKLAHLVYKQTTNLRQVAFLYKKLEIDERKEQFAAAQQDDVVANKIKAIGERRSVSMQTLKDIMEKQKQEKLSIQELEDKIEREKREILAKKIEADAGDTFRQQQVKLNFEANICELEISFKDIYIFKNTDHGYGLAMRAQFRLAKNFERKMDVIHKLLVGIDRYCRTVIANLKSGNILIFLPDLINKKRRNPMDPLLNSGGFTRFKDISFENFLTINENFIEKHIFEVDSAKIKQKNEENTVIETKISEIFDTKKTEIEIANTQIAEIEIKKKKENLDEENADIVKTKTDEMEKRQIQAYQERVEIDIVQLEKDITQSKTQTIIQEPEVFIPKIKINREKDETIFKVNDYLLKLKELRLEHLKIINFFKEVPKKFEGIDESFWFLQARKANTLHDFIDPCKATLTACSNDLVRSTKPDKNQQIVMDITNIQLPKVIVSMTHIKKEINQLLQYCNLVKFYYSNELVETAPLPSNYFSDAKNIPIDDLLTEMTGTLLSMIKGKSEKHVAIINKIFQYIQTNFNKQCEIKIKKENLTDESFIKIIINEGNKHFIENTIKVDKGKILNTPAVYYDLFDCLNALFRCHNLMLFKRGNNSEKLVLINTENQTNAMNLVREFETKKNYNRKDPKTIEELIIRGTVSNTNAAIKLETIVSNTNDIKIDEKKNNNNPIIVPQDIIAKHSFQNSPAILINIPDTLPIFSLRDNNNPAITVNVPETNPKLKSETNLGNLYMTGLETKKKSGIVQRNYNISFEPQEFINQELSLNKYLTKDEIFKNFERIKNQDRVILKMPNSDLIVYNTRQEDESIKALNALIKGYIVINDIADYNKEFTPEEQQNQFFDFLHDFEKYHGYRELFQSQVTGELLIMNLEGIAITEETDLYEELKKMYSFNEDLLFVAVNDKEDILFFPERRSFLINFFSPDSFDMTTNLGEISLLQTLTKSSTRLYNERKELLKQESRLSTFFKDKVLFLKNTNNLKKQIKENIQITTFETNEKLVNTPYIAENLTVALRKNATDLKFNDIKKNEKQINIIELSNIIKQKNTKKLPNIETQMFNYRERVGENINTAQYNTASENFLVNTYKKDMGFKELFVTNNVESISKNYISTDIANINSQFVHTLFQFETEVPQILFQGLSVPFFIALFPFVLLLALWLHNHRYFFIFILFSFLSFIGGIVEMLAAFTVIVILYYLFNYIFFSKSNSIIIGSSSFISNFKKRRNI